MQLNFKEDKYKKIAMQSRGYSEVETTHKISDAFLLLLKGINQGDLLYLCKKMQNDLKNKNIIVTLDECYKITQCKFENCSIDEIRLKEITKKEIGDYLFDLSYECIEKDKRHLGENVINATINTSSWISHSIYEAKAAQILARIIGLNGEKMAVLALLHDYGRKYIHDFSHVTRGFEELVDEGWIDEARATITHSFINAGRCANCDPAEDGFFIDSNGNAKWIEETEKDDVTKVLEVLEYDDYDMILNISDLMATDRGITSPFDRVQDVATRKKPDIRNRGYFLSEFTNKLIYIMKRVDGYFAENLNPLMDLEKINSKFKTISNDFYGMFLREKMKIKSSNKNIDEYER